MFFLARLQLLGGVLAATLLLPAGGEAQSSRDIPAEFPPASYEGRQYIDSRGCYYVRAGFDGAIDWVPRISRSRQHVCGGTPTFGGSQARAVTPTPSDAQVIAPPAAVAAPQPAAR
ncbi:SPOR domain-containing protein, partial [Litorisediminicola beolgyonensis]